MGLGTLVVMRKGNFVNLIRCVSVVVHEEAWTLYHHQFHSLGLYIVADICLVLPS